MVAPPGPPVATQCQSHWRIYIYVCTDFSSKESHRQVGVDIVVISGSPCGVMVITLAQNAKDMGSIPTLGTIFPIFITLTTLVAVIMVLYTVWLLNLPCMHTISAYM